MTQADTPYPLQFSVGYPDRPLNRLTMAFRLVTVIPIAIVLGALGGGGDDAWLAAGSLLFLAPLLMILFRRKYPRWWFDWNLALMRFSSRVFVYLALLRDEYPSTDEEQAVHLEVEYPDAESDLNRWLPLVKWLLATTPPYCAVFPLYRRARRRVSLVVRHTVHRPLSQRPVRFRRWGEPVDQPGHGLCAHAGHRPVSSLPPWPVSVAFWEDSYQ